MKIEIVLPILNEEKSLSQQVGHLKDYLKTHEGQGNTFLLTIADNGSTDRSPLIGAEIANSIEGVKYLKIGQRGVGLALKKSWLDSDADIIGFMDLDFATDLKHLEQCWEILRQKEYDIVCGTRNKQHSHVINRSLRRTFISRVFNVLIKTIFHTKFTDGMCGFKFLKRESLSIVLENGIGFDDWFFSTELLIVAEYVNLSIYDLPVTWTDDRNSKVKILELTKMYLIDMIRLKGMLRKKSALRAKE
jgi:glycosyltransferase involved in cell wall biosynthesis